MRQRNAAGGHGLGENFLLIIIIFVLMCVLREWLSLVMRGGFDSLELGAIARASVLELDKGSLGCGLFKTDRKNKLILKNQPTAL